MLSTYQIVISLATVAILLLPVNAVGSDADKKPEKPGATESFWSSLNRWFQADPNKSFRTLAVIDPYLEVRTGPGRGYPVTQVLEQGEKLQLLSRRANWYRIRLMKSGHVNRTIAFNLSDSSDSSSLSGAVGWVSAESLARTLAPSGIPAALPSVSHGDYLESQARVGFSSGFNEGADNYSVIAGYRALSFAGIEAEVGQSFTPTLDGSNRSMNLLVEPFQNWSFTPFFIAGIGKQEFKKKNKFAGSDQLILSDYSFNGLGINYYLGFNFVVRGEFRELQISGREGKERSSEWRLGFSTFF